MTKLNMVAAGALTLGLAATAFAVHAQPYGKGGNYSLAPATRAAEQAGHRPDMQTAKCDCATMKGTAAKPGAPG